jgi:hypothetical protein
MNRSLNALFLILIIIFFFNIYKYYISNENLKVKDFNRNNIDKIINKNVSDLKVLYTDTNNVIEFNNSLSNIIGNEKPRSFWDLLKSK